MARRWGVAFAAVLMLATGCGVEVQRVANAYDYAAGYLSGQNVQRSGEDKAAGCAEQFLSYEAAMDERPNAQVKEHFSQGCADGFDDVDPAMWPGDQAKP
ncbi:hypothetical protein [Streptomyces sp. AS02]|uniref:hypothetical protein n=1 Tax=Streptomyces sp. AS02 TaxID=2938946 RepID=UPI0020221D4E|nr:hypothetical protein [Streptomyces sp. AS02]MCL8013808.1 hypothetical protein [Streptomyces sp. AS02]